MEILEFILSSIIPEDFVERSSTVLMIIVEAMAATRIRAMNTIMAPIPMLPLSSFTWSAYLINVLLFPKSTPFFKGKCRKMCNDGSVGRTQGYECVTIQPWNSVAYTTLPYG